MGENENINIKKEKVENAENKNSNFKTVVSTNPYNAKKLRINQGSERVYYYHFLVEW